MAQLVRVSRHALEQHTARWPGELTIYERTTQITSETLAALLAGRTSRKEPAWTGHGAQMTRRERKQRRQHWQGISPNARYVWTEARDRVYLVDQRGGLMKVVTAIGGVTDTTQPDG